MKHERLRTLCTALALGLFTAWGAIFCLASAFDLPLAHPRLLVLICGAAAGLSALLLTFRRGGTALLCLLALLLGYLWQDGAALRQLWQLCYRLSTVYDRAYGCGVLILPAGMAPGHSFDWPLGLWAVLVTAAISRSICRQKSVWLPMLLTLAPLASCVVVTDTVPQERWLLMVMTGLVLLLLTAPVRQENAYQGLRLTTAAALPVLAGLTVLFLAVPQENYVNRSAVLRENLLTAAEYLPQLMEGGMEELSAGLQGKERRQVDLAHLGPRIPFTYPVLDVTAPSSGSLYLRRQDFDRYDGFSWSSTEGRQELVPPVSGPEEAITITTRTRQDLRFLSYYPAGEVTLRDGCLENTAGETQYILRRVPVPKIQPEPAATPWPEYQALPEATRQSAAALLEGLYPPDATHAAKAEAIAGFVMAAARYDLNPGTMPSGQPDFALWFLKEGEKGYCVHFATAAAVLLRAADIPARYVTGYMAETEGGRTVTVTEENAHAWAEYFEPSINAWVVLEATPAAASTPETAPTESTAPATVPTEPTAPVTEPTVSLTVPVSTDPPELPTAVPEAPAPETGGFLPLILIPLVLAILGIQRRLRLMLRRNRQRRGPANQQALARWQEALRLSRLLKESPTEELIVLAQKAKFSQHELEAEELMAFDSFQRICLRRLREKPWYLRLIDQYIHAAY